MIGMANAILGYVDFPVSLGAAIPTSLCCCSRNPFKIVATVKPLPRGLTASLMLRNGPPPMPAFAILVDAGTALSSS